MLETEWCALLFVLRAVSCDEYGNDEGGGGCGGIGCSCCIDLGEYLGGVTTRICGFEDGTRTLGELRSFATSTLLPFNRLFGKWFLGNSPGSERQRRITINSVRVFLN